MKIIRTLTLCVVFCSALAWGQTYGANVNESSETVLITVDQALGNNLSPCVTGSIFKTIGAAAACALLQNESVSGAGSDRTVRFRG
ncbi:MAG TPA: hypothetical protein VGW33_09020 [Terriglobia bacterium]|nr:hypothetical protein [Terriglobia bacterium]